MISINPTSDDLRAEIARKQIHLYQLAPAAGINPNRLGQMLNGKLELSMTIAERVVKALSTVNQEKK